ncbi:DMT family transporter [Mycoavidus sp. SF9855]|uniref:DMT family transporter n=1 Tax=Mycoavidus sp. SF9855 TaxID=2968475 RepID=UPI0027961AB8|nr:DMT family transporter [Mycoavidus sp. SF9855]
MSPREIQGMLLGLLSVILFSITLPMTRITIMEIHPLLNGLGRSFIAAIPAAILLAWRREKWPTKQQMKGLAVVALGAIIVFPVCTAWAMRTLPASHGAIVNGLQPLCVAIYAVWFAREKPSRTFWLCSIIGSTLIITYAMRASGGTLMAGDIFMLIAVVFGALGYTEGGRLAKQMGGWRVICWALVISAPVLVIPVTLLAWHHTGPISLKSWLAFGYAALISQFFGLFIWYAGLALGGIARVSQVQQLQVFFTLAFSTCFFGEEVGSDTWLFAAAVVFMLALSSRTRIAALPPSSITPAQKIAHN